MITIVLTNVFSTIFIANKITIAVCKIFVPGILFVYDYKFNV